MILRIISKIEREINDFIDEWVGETNIIKIPIKELDISKKELYKMEPYIMSCFKALWAVEIDGDTLYLEIDLNVLEAVYAAKIDENERNLDV